MTIVRRARPADLASFPVIEAEAARLFDGTDLLDGLAATFSPASAWESAEQAGTVWVCDDDGATVGFLAAMACADALHIDEVDVAPSHQRRGLGRALIEAALAWARARRLPAATLTTFRAVPWNAPFYVRLGFAEVEAHLAPPRLREILERETTTGLRATDRCAMILRLQDPA